MSLRGAERRSKLRDKIASPLARNDISDRRRGDKGGEVIKVDTKGENIKGEFKRGEAPLQISYLCGEV